MLEAGTMLLFCAVLFASVALGWSIIPALFVGVLLFMGYGLVRRFPPVPCWSNSLRIRTCSILLPACCARVRCRLC